MFKLNLKIALRNLFKNKVYAAINIGGLALGLTAFLLMLLYINHEESYDTWSADLKNVYQIREKHSFFTPDNQDYWQEISNSRVAALIKQNVPQFTTVTKVDQEWGNGFSVKIDHADPILIKGIKDADSAFFNVFPYHFVQGNEKTALKEPNTVVLKQGLAIKLYGTDRVLGKVFKLVRWRNDEGTPLKITGVIADTNMPESVSFNAISHTGDQDHDPDQVGSSHYNQVYAKSANYIDTLSANKSLQKVYVDFKKKSLAAEKRNFNDIYKNGRTPGLKAIPLKDVHANPPFAINWLNKLKPVIGITIFLLLVSIINFVNLATAQSVQRAKEVGVKKVLGAYKKQLIVQFLIESALQSVVSLFLSVILIEVLLPAFNHQFNVELTFWHNQHFLSIAWQLIVVFIVVTLLAGFYPAWILSGYHPVSVLKGNYENSLKGIVLRNILVVFQFGISVTFIIAIGVMQMQTRYISNKDLGFERDKLINLQTGYDQDFANKIRRIPGVQYVSTTTQVMGNAFNNKSEIVYKGREINLNGVTVTMDALQTLGVKLISGRLFAKEYKQDTINSVVLNEAAANLLGKNMVGQTYGKVDYEGKTITFQIVGVIKNYHNEGFDKAVLPTVYKVTSLGGTSNTNNLLVRFDTKNYKGIINKIEAEWKKLYPDFPLQYQSMDEAFSEILEENKRFMNMIVLFSVVSVSLSLLGLFALSTFVAKRRTKEIAVRKVLGASNIQIVNLLNKSFLILVIVANLISWPIAYILVKKWLEGFAYRIDMPVYPFMLATVISIIIAVLTVSIQARKAATGDPVNALKYE
ncbi:FtsX-like permease family protein [Pedobacter sp. HDW13]|uniref:ABC transporter permease n=1 Tax=Pedobacter sp. HDW13 TaxID=2714940 RepID=UPI001408A2BD|nr:FtsX-like permease family protein [Pedobacter sp. HDW13]QIL41150.1 FtsX-like permease family protein [Pedobacter sp. HDW13]